MTTYTKTTAGPPTSGYYQVGDIVLDSNNVRWTCQVGGFSPTFYQTDKDVWALGTGSVHATAATFADVSGLTCAMLSGRKYAFEAMIIHKANATTTGAQFGYNIGAAPTVAILGAVVGVTNAAGATPAAFAMGSTATRDTAAPATDTSSATDTVTMIKGYIQPSADGTFAIRATSEVTVAAGLTVEIGSWLHVRDIT